MGSRQHAIALSTGLLTLALIAATGFDAAPTAVGSTAYEASIFGSTKVWSVHLDITATEYTAMQPAVGGGFGPPSVPKVEEKRDGNKRDRDRNLFGTEFPWVEGDFTADGKTAKKIGVRYSGDITYFVTAQSLKRPLKLSFDKFGGGRFEGLTGVQLHAMPLDPSKAREALAYAAFRAAGVPAPRTAFAEVTLTVPGRHDKAFLGLYTVVEDIDGAFVAEHFGSDKGLLMKPFGLRGIDYLGEDWTRYSAHYRPQREATKDEAKRVVDFAKLVNQASDDEFKKQIGSFLDVEAFLRFTAANALTANLQGFHALGHNYHLYLDPKTNRFSFLPADLEFSFANFLLMGTGEQLLNLSITKPYPGENKLPDRLLAIKEVNYKYRMLLKELTATAFTKDGLIRDAESIETATKVVRDKEAKAVAARREPPAGFGGPAPQPPDIKAFAEKRTASVAAQLAGTGQGYVPTQPNFGPPPGGGRANAQPITEQIFRTEVRVPDGFGTSRKGAGAW